jgi:hypothetical protein
MSTFLERIQRTDDDAPMLMLLEVSAPSFPEVLRIVNDTQNCTSNGVEYIASQFGFKLPDDVSGQAPRAQLVLSNVGRAITEDLERLAPGEIVTARVLIISRADPDFIEQDHLLPMMSVSVNTQTAAAACGVDFLTRQQAVRLRFSPHVSPGIF